MSVTAQQCELPPSDDLVWWLAQQIKTLKKFTDEVSVLQLDVWLGVETTVDGHVRIHCEIVPRLCFEVLGQLLLRFGRQFDYLKLAGLLSFGPGSEQLSSTLNLLLESRGSAHVVFTRVVASRILKKQVPLLRLH